MALALRDTFNHLKIKACDFVAIGAVVFASIAIFTTYLCTASATAEVCVIEVDGKEYASYDLSSVSEKKIVEIDNIYGKNIIVIYNDGAEIIYSDCPDGREVKDGRITASGQSLICLPHRLCVRLEGKKSTDAVSW